MNRVGRTAAFVLAGVVAVVGAAVAVTGIRAAGYPAYWRDRAAEPAEAGALRIVALGDSSMTAVGTLDPENGIAGRIASLAVEVTGRPVHLANRAVGGATIAEVLADQVDPAEVAAADLVIVSTTNDLQRGVDLDAYRQSLETLFAVLPAERTVMSDLPPMAGRDRYQAVLEEVAAAHGVALAPAGAVFEGPGRRLDVFSFLPPHLNDVGYGFWADAFAAPVRAILLTPQR